MAGADAKKSRGHWNARPNERHDLAPRERLDKEVRNDAVRNCQLCLPAIVGRTDGEGFAEVSRRKGDPITGQGGRVDMRPR
jgi:hypothetical protein